MKHIITAIFLALAVAAGLLLPEVFMKWQDQELEIPQLVSITEPTLEWNPSKGQAAKEVTSEDIAHRLKLFETGPATTVPICTATTDEVIWAASRAIEFLGMACEVMPDVEVSDAEYQLAWFPDGTTVNFWTAYVSFNGGWRCIMTIDAQSSAILQLIVNPNGANLAELFPESFERAATEPDTYFEELVSQRFCDALGFFMGRNDGAENSVIPSLKSGSAVVTFSDDPDLQVETFFIVDLAEGIRFNNP